MVQDVSGFGLTVNLQASSTYPTGLSITEFAADTDPLDMASVDIADTLMGLNGDLIVWAKAVPLPMAVAVIPGSIDDTNLQILADANRVGPGKASAADVIQAAVVYPDGSIVQLNNGRIISAMFGRSVAGSGMQKTRVYTFKFESKTGL